MASKKTPQTLTAMSQTNTGTWAQEMYETASRQSGRRAAQLRKLGYIVTVGSLGYQVTSVGTVKTTIVDIRPGSNPDTFGLPPVEVMRW